MALINFPVNPDNGDIYPQNPIPGQAQYQWDATNLTWRLLGSATGVVADTYGDAYNVGQFTVDSTGRITFAQNVQIAFNEGTVTEVDTGAGLTGGPITSSGTISLDVAYTDNLYLAKAGGVMTGPVVFAAGQTFPGTVTNVATGAGLTGGPITSTGTISLNTAFTDGRYLRLVGGTLTGDLRLPNGLASSPSLGFTSSPSSGLFLDGSGNVGVSQNGNSKVTFGSTAATFFSNVVIPSGYNASVTGILNLLQSGGQVRFYDADNSNYVGFLGPSNVTSNVMWVLPNSDGSAGQVLSTDGSGTLSWGAAPANTLQAVTTAGNTTTNTITTDTVTTTGAFQVDRAGSTVALISDTGSFVPSLTIAGLDYPTVDGSPGQVLTTDGAGTLSWGAQPGSGTVTSIATADGVTGGPITTTGTISLANSGVSSGTYTYATVTVDSKGRILVASSGTAPNTTVTAPATNTGTAIAPVIGVQTATTGQLGAIQVGTNIDVAAGVISVKSSSTTQSGIVQLNNTVASTSTTEALTAAQGKALQDQISTLAVTSNLTLAGTFDATASQMLTVTADGTAQSFVVGNDLPAAAAGNIDYFVIVTTPGNYSPPGGGGPYPANQGDWFLSNGASWQYLNVGSDLPTASTGTAGIVELATALETQAGTSTTLAVTPAGAAATYIRNTCLSSKGAILSATGANVPAALAVGGDNQILTACASAPTGLCWVTPPTPVAAIPCSVLTAKGALVAASGANTPAALTVGVNGQVLAACSTEATGLCWITPPPPTPQATPTVSGTILGRVSLGSGGLGFRALNSLTTGTFNVGIGQEAGCSLTTGNRNVAVGALALELGTTMCDNVGLGVEALRRTTTGGRNVAIGTTTLVFNTTGADNVAVGYDAGRANTTGFQNTAIGYQSMRVNNTFSQNTAVGAFTLCAFNGGTNGANDAFGALAMQAFTTGDYNVSLGAYSLFCYTSGCFNTAVGHRAMTDVTTGACNTAVGAYAGQSLTTGICNTAVGYGAQVLNGNNNTVLGNGAQNVSGASNSVTLGNTNITVIRAAVTSITAISDARDKTDVTALPVGLDFVNSLNPVKFTWQMREPNEVKDGTSEAGFIAQDLKAAQEAAGADYLGLVYDENPERLEASSGKLIPVLVKAIQELSEEVNVLKDEINKLKIQG